MGSCAGIPGGIRGGGGESVTGGYSRGQCEPYGGTVYDVGGVPCSCGQRLPVLSTAGLIFVYAVTFLFFHSFTQFAFCNHITMVRSLLGALQINGILDKFRLKKRKQLTDN